MIVLRKSTTLGTNNRKPAKNRITTTRIIPIIIKPTIIIQIIIIITTKILLLIKTKITIIKNKIKTALSCQ